MGSMGAVLGETAGLSSSGAEVPGSHGCHGNPMGWLAPRPMAPPLQGGEIHSREGS